MVAYLMLARGIPPWSSQQHVQQVVSLLCEGKGCVDKVPPPLHAQIRGQGLLRGRGSPQLTPVWTSKGQAAGHSTECTCPLSGYCGRAPSWEAALQLRV